MHRENLEVKSVTFDDAKKYAHWRYETHQNNMDIIRLLLQVEIQRFDRVMPMDLVYTVLVFTPLSELQFGLCS